ncbi:MAG: hypothetical protein BWX55_00370 [Deltaproteobacteria bacterium ADurb.Bin022]|nr:MAG: hypothetical protein BWX55_00370 [Deltaproteobacteria bacterium ADurb.Bin022]
MSDGQLAGQLLERFFLENLGRQPHAFVLVYIAAVRADDAGGFLAAMLKGKKTVKRYAGCFFMTVSGKNTAFFAGIISLFLFFFR